MTDETVFRGGVNVVRRRGNVIYRPATEYSPTLHRLLGHLHRRDFDGAPRPLGFDADGNEMLTYVEGTVHEALTQRLRTSLLLDSAARLLRRLHDATADFARSSDDRWALPARSPVEVICHGDFAPYNCTVAGGQVVGVIDFDVAHPGPRLWDVAYAVYRFAPLHAPSNPDSAGDPARQASLAARFCRAYGVAAGEALLDTVIERVEATMKFIRERADSGDPAFARHIADGHLLLYETDIAYLRDQREVMLRAFAAAPTSLE